MPKQQPDPDLERLWRARLHRWRASGLSARVFCTRESLSESSFYFWRAELQRRDATRPAPARPAFVPLYVPATPPTPPTPPPPVSLELLTAGVTLRIPPGCDPALLRAVLAVLKELREQPC